MHNILYTKFEPQTSSNIRYFLCKIHRIYHCEITESKKLRNWDGDWQLWDHLYFASNITNTPLYIYNMSPKN